MGIRASERETRRRSAGRVDCVKCGRGVTLWQETDEWIQTRTGRLRHSGYGPGAGECCGLLYADTGERIEVFVLDGQPAREERSA